jgi:hypothetical protein
MQQEKSLPPPTRTVIGVGLVITAIYVASLLILMGTTDYDTWGAMLVAPVLIFLTLPALHRQAHRERDRRLFAILILALLVKLGGGIVRDFVAFDVYKGVADANFYDQDGKELAKKFRVGNFDTGREKLVGTQFIRVTTGVTYAIIGPSKLGGFLVYSWLGFWGLFLFYRAFTIAVPEGRHRTYARMLFFLPSLVFWPSSIGKEAWIMFALGITAFGAAHLLTTRLWRGLAIASLGMWLVALPRPHVAGLMALGIAGGYLVRKPRSELRQLAPLVKGLAFVIIGVVALLFVARASTFLKDQGIQTDQGVGTALRQVSSETTFGQSRFVPSVFESPARAPIALITVLFRPFVFEAHNAQALVTAIEGTFLLALAFFRIPWVVAAIKSMRRQPYVAFAFVYTGLFIVAFSSFANFGLLARERVQLFPLYLVLLSIPPPSKREQPAR